jgi:hypothetical protein
MVAEGTRLSLKAGSDNAGPHPTARAIPRMRAASTRDTRLWDGRRARQVEVSSMRDRRGPRHRQLGLENASGDDYRARELAVRSRVSTPGRASASQGRRLRSAYTPRVGKNVTRRALNLATRAECRVSCADAASPIGHRGPDPYQRTGTRRRTLARTLRFTTSSHPRSRRVCDSPIGSTAEGGGSPPHPGGGMDH